MISYLANIVNFIAATIQKTFYLASYIGQLIVILITSIVLLIFKTIANVALFLQIVYEDNVRIFTDEIPSFATSVTETISLQCYNIYFFIFVLCSEVCAQISAIYSSVYLSFEAVFIVISEVFFLIKRALIFLGDTFWFILTFLPVHLPYLIKTVLLTVKECLVSNIIDLYMSLLRISNFLSDVPLESFLGIMLAIISTRLCIAYREVVYAKAAQLYWTCLRKIMFIYYHVYNYFIDTEARVITQITGHTVSPPVVDEVFDDATNSADACVICQERQKCVLILPCRHVCLCCECCLQLYSYQRTCPICRTFIYHSVNIYL